MPSRWVVTGPGRIGAEFDQKILGKMVNPLHKTALTKKYGEGYDTVVPHKKKASVMIRAASDTSALNDDPAVFSPGQLDSAEMPGESYKNEYKYDFESFDRKKQDAAIKADSELKALKEATEKELKTFLSKAIVEGTVPADTWHRGEVTMEKIPDLEIPHEIKVIVTVLDEKHEFMYNTVR